MAIHWLNHRSCDIISEISLCSVCIVAELSWQCNIICICGVQNACSMHQAFMLNVVIVIATNVVVLSVLLELAN